jgi:hypothetical protein
MLEVYGLNYRSVTDCRCKSKLRADTRNLQRAVAASKRLPETESACDLELMRDERDAHDVTPRPAASGWEGMGGAAGEREAEGATKEF